MVTGMHSIPVCCGEMPSCAASTRGPWSPRGFLSVPGGKYEIIMQWFPWFSVVRAAIYLDRATAETPRPWRRLCRFIRTLYVPCTLLESLTFVTSLKKAFRFVGAIQKRKHWDTLVFFQWEITAGQAASIRGRRPAPRDRKIQHLCRIGRDWWLFF